MNQQPPEQPQQPQYPQQPYYPPQQQPPYPYPPVPQQPQKKNKVWLWVIGIIGAVALCGCAGFVGLGMMGSRIAGSALNNSSNNTGTLSNSSTQNANNTQPTQAAQHFKAGQTVKVGSTWEITVNGVKTSQGDSFDTPKPGMTFLLIDVTLKNVSDQEQPVSSLIMWTLRDPSGQQYTETITTIAGAPPDGKAAAGSPVRGTLAYEVPTSGHSFTLAFQADIIASGQTLWDITI